MSKDGKRKQWEEVMLQKERETEEEDMLEVQKSKHLRRKKK